MRVGVYVDGFNVYFGGRTLCGAGTPGWRWLDLRALAETLVAQRRNWSDARLERVIYCTALISGRDNPGGRRDQDTYVRALQQTGSVDHIELGYYVSRVKTAPLATRDKKGRPVLVRSQWPVMVQDASGADAPNSIFMVSYAHREEKGSDVNLASHLLTDVLTGSIDAALVLSNDSDLRFPIEQARGHVPVGLINPTGGTLAGALRGTPNQGAGRHWWKDLSAADFRNHQLPDPAAGNDRPTGW